MPRKLIDITGHKFGKLTVKSLGESYIKKNGNKGTPFWVCECECGNYHNARGFDLRSGKVVSCGCHKPNLRHGMCKTRIYKIWHDMKSRCVNPRDTGYSYYGGRGIKYSREWEMFDNFYRDMGECPSDRHTIDRIDSDGDYEPRNCRWATRSQQMKNRRPFDTWNQKIPHSEVKKIRGSKEPSKELAERYGVSYKHICAIKNGNARSSR